MTKSKAALDPIPIQKSLREDHPPGVKKKGQKVTFLQGKTKKVKLRTGGKLWRAKAGEKPSLLVREE